MESNESKVRNLISQLTDSPEFIRQVKAAVGKTPEALERKLEAEGLDEARKKLRLGKFEDKEVPHVEAWVKDQEFDKTRGIATRSNRIAVLAIVAAIGSLVVSIVK